MKVSGALRCLLVAAAVSGLARVPAARADGAMVYRGEPLFREGPPSRGYCAGRDAAAKVECDRVLVKMLSGYGYARGHAAGGLVADPGSGIADASGVGELRFSAIAAALPGGDLALATIEGVLGDTATRRIRVTMASAEGLFFCRDTHSGALVAPFIGMLTRACAPDAVFALDAAVITAQWDLAIDELSMEWARLGPAFELLGNGLGHEHLLRSVEIAFPFDVRTSHEFARSRDTAATLGIGLRISALYRTPRWEGRATSRYRTVLVGGDGPLSNPSLEGELLLLHNFFFVDALVMQLGLSLRASYSRGAERVTALWASADRRADLFAGLHLGWIPESPDL